MDKVREIDLEKQKIEIKYIPILRYTFRHMAADAKALYITTKSVPAKALADNYRPEFLKIIRDAQRETIKKFGFDLRIVAEEKGYDFRTAKYKALIEYHIETKDTGSILNATQTEKINNTFAIDAALFVANTSEEQADYITDTNEKELSDAEKLAVILFFQEQGKLTNKLDKLRNDKAKIEFEEMLGGSQSVAAAKKRKIQEEIVKTEAELQELNKNKDKFIGDDIEQRIIEKGASRSELIASQNVKMAESWKKQRSRFNKQRNSRASN